MADPEVREFLRKFVRIRLWTDQRANAGENERIKNEIYDYKGLPLYIFLTRDGKEAARLPSSLTNALPSARDFLDAFHKTLQASTRFHESVKDR
jgi:hypothetical protein